MSSSPFPLSALLETYVRDRINLTPGSIGRLAIAVRLLSRWLDRPATVGDLSRDSLLDWMRWLAQSRTPRTVNGKRAAILSLWIAAAENGLCAPPPPRLPKLVEPRRVPVAWTVAEVERILAACDRLDGSWDGVPVALCWRIAVLLLWDTGLRLAGLLGARLVDVDLAAGTLFVPAEHLKGRRGDRLFRLHRQTLDAIAISMPSDRELLFPFPCRPKQIWPHLKRILRTAGLPCDRHRLFHCLRRSAESHAAAAMGIEWAAAAIGHGVEVARRSYIAPAICRPPALIEALPRPRLPS